MKKFFAVLIAVAVAVGITGCTGSKEKMETTWECLMIIGENPEEYVFDGQEIQTAGGVLTIYNNQWVEIDVCLAYEDENGETVIVFEETIKGGGVYQQYYIDEDVVYKIGIRADVERGEDISVSVLEKDAVRTPRQLSDK